MRRLRPHDCFTVAPGYDEKPLADCWRSIVTCPEFAPVHHVAKIAELSHPALKRHALAAWTRLVIDERAPRPKFLDVLQNDDIGLRDTGPFQDDPGNDWTYPDEFQVLHVMSTAGASVLAVDM
jgi:hypothetical protein